MLHSSDSPLMTTIHKSDSFPLITDHWWTDYTQVLLIPYWYTDWSPMAQSSTLDPAYWSLMDHDSSPYCTPLTLPCRHLALLYISQPSGYLVAPVLTWLLSWLPLYQIPVGFSLFIPLCATAPHHHLFIPRVSKGPLCWAPLINLVIPEGAS